MEKTYPRATVLRLPTGAWTVDLYDHPGGRNYRLANTFKAQGFAMDKAALAVDNRRHIADAAAAVRTNTNQTTSRPGATRPQIRPCEDCGRPTRPSTFKAADHPGTVVRVGNGRCASCYAKARKDTATTAPAPKVKAPVAEPSIVILPKGVQPAKPFPFERPAVARPIRLHDGTHTAQPTGNGWWECACGWDPTINAASYIETRGEAAAAVREHVRSTAA